MVCTASSSVRPLWVWVVQFAASVSLHKAYAWCSVTDAMRAASLGSCCSTDTEQKTVGKESKIEKRAMDTKELALHPRKNRKHLTRTC